MSLQSSVINSPLGKLKLTSQDELLNTIEFDSQLALNPPDNKIDKLICSQLDCYFNDAAYSFNLPVLCQGTEFQKRVWAMLCKIPVGEVWTYGQMAKILSSSARAVGNACRRNPTPILVPCHRIVSASGLGGFAGQTAGRLTEIKKILLKHEGAKIG